MAVAAEPMDFVVDAGWLGHTGVGRLTSQFLAGLAELRPAGNWTVWGPPSVTPLLWPGAHIVSTRHPPMSWMAQRDIASVPQGFVISLHVVRPLALWRPGAVLIHDTIPLRWDRRARRRSWRVFFALSAHASRTVLTDSEATADRVVKDLRIARARIRVVRPTADTALVRRIAEARRARREEPEPLLLYVGLVRPHKNLTRAIDAFSQSRFARSGGRFALVGNRGSTIADAPSGVIQRPAVTEAELVEWYTMASAVILPSLEEGFGLPILEALASGIPACCSDIEPLRTVAQGQAVLFDPYSIRSIADAIDRATSAPPPGPVETGTDRDFAESVIRALPGGDRLLGHC